LAELAHIRPQSSTWVRGLALAGVLLGFTVVVLGAYVRLTAAGLGCPDWPGCYGHLSPLGAQSSVAASVLDVGKAWREMVHRYAAGSLVLIIVTIAATALATRQVLRRYGLALLLIVVLQAALGMLTVTWRLTPLIVTLHLLFGLTTLALLWWLWLSLRQPGQPRTPALAPGERRGLNLAVSAALLGLLVLVVQIALGGWTSSNYAAIACPDFPTCQGSSWPRMDYRDAFVLWHSAPLHYEGGALDSAARVAIHFTHRLGALLLTCVLLLVAAIVLRQRALRRVHGTAVLVVLALALQLAIGISMVLRGFPLWLATAHNGGAALTLLAVLALLHGLRSLRRQI
jgi:cytochrome c oxidase assembly protein subunit 15